MEGKEDESNRSLPRILIGRDGATKPWMIRSRLNRSDGPPIKHRQDRALRDPLDEMMKEKEQVQDEKINKVQDEKMLNKDNTILDFQSEVVLAGAGLTEGEEKFDPELPKAEFAGVDPDLTACQGEFLSSTLRYSYETSGSSLSSTPTRLPTLKTITPRSVDIQREILQTTNRSSASMLRGIVNEGSQPLNESIVGTARGGGEETAQDKTLKVEEDGAKTPVAEDSNLENMEKDKLEKSSSENPQGASRFSKWKTPTRADRGEQISNIKSATNSSRQKSREEAFNKNRNIEECRAEEEPEEATTEKEAKEVGEESAEDGIFRTPANEELGSARLRISVRKKRERI
jgi:hypothetical protein